MRTTEFVESYFDAWNHGDAVAVADHLADDGTYIDVPENVSRSHDELIVTLKQFFATNRLRYELVGEILADESTVAFQYCMKPNSASAVVDIIHGAEFITLRDSAAVQITDYYERPDIERSAELATATSSGKYAKSGLSIEQLDKYKKRLNWIMQEEQIYLRPELTLPRLARVVGCTVNHLSQVINAGFGMSFFDYMNHYRVEKAKQLLASPGDHGTAVLNVAYSVGFNSNSAFYSAFKKSVGQTPAQYRRTRLKPSH
jgi:AraC-like DNA-binding protein